MPTKEPFGLTSFADFASFDEHRHSPHSIFRYTMPRDIDFIQDEHDYYVEFYCAVCDQPTPMAISKHLSFMEGGLHYPLWRETISCPGCGLNNRQRALLHLMAASSNFPTDARIYCTEQITKTFRSARKTWPKIVGSEYLRDGTPNGQTNAIGIRCEDMTNLSFDDSSFDGLVTMDVIEHVPDYKAALGESFRVLRPGGQMLLSAPFNLDIVTSQVRAIVKPSGEIEHLMTPEIHGDPLDPDGLLCFTTFGWDFLETLRQVGFENPTMNFYWSDHFGYLGVQYCILAKKPEAPRRGLLANMGRWFRQ